jgi:HK97 family phage major capsid protein
MGNAYLDNLNDRYAQLKASIDGLQTRAVDEQRDLSEDELRSIKEMGDQGKLLATQIEDLTDIETRQAKVAQMAAELLTTTGEGKAGQGGGAGDPQTRGTVQLGGATTRDRDPGHYTRGSANSFFGDLYRSRVFSDELSARRLIEHTRALDTTGEGVGVVPPKWLTEEFETLARQGRMLASGVRNIPLGDDPRPMTLPKQTTGTDAVLAEQTNENDPVPGTDAWDSDVDVVSPKPTTGKQIVSRQMLDMSSPAIDQLIYGDLIAVYNDKVETKVCSTLLTAAGAAEVTFALDATNFVQPGATDSVVDLAIAVRGARKLPATLLAMRTRRWGKFKKLKDTTGRPIIPSGSAGPVNVVGVGSVQADGIIEDLPVIVTDGLGTSAYPESFIALRASDTILFESNLLRFRFEEQAGPESIVLGIWGYTAVIVRQTPGAVGTQSKSVRRAQITAA